MTWEFITVYPMVQNHFEMAHSSLSTAASSSPRPINQSQYFDVYCGIQFYGIRVFTSSLETGILLFLRLAVCTVCIVHARL